MGLRTVFLERVGLKLAQLSISERAASMRAGLGASWLKDLRRREQDPGLENVADLARVLGCSVSWLIGESDVDETLPALTKPELVRVVGEVRASNFRPAFELPRDRQRPLWLSPDPRYPGVHRFALDVSGPSVDMEAPEGSVLICAGLQELERKFGRRPKNDDLVIVQAWRHDLVEATCKAYVEKADGLWLEPRSTQNDIPAIHVADAQGELLVDADTVIVHALVLEVHKAV